MLRTALQNYERRLSEYTEEQKEEDFYKVSHAFGLNEDLPNIPKDWDALELAINERQHTSIDLTTLDGLTEQGKSKLFKLLRSLDSTKVLSDQNPTLEKSVLDQVEFVVCIRKGEEVGFDKLQNRMLDQAMEIIANVNGKTATLRYVDLEPTPPKVFCFPACVQTVVLDNVPSSFYSKCVPKNIRHLSIKMTAGGSQLITDLQALLSALIIDSLAITCSCASLHDAFSSQICKAACRSITLNGNVIKSVNDDKNIRTHHSEDKWVIDAAAVANILPTTQILHLKDCILSPDAAKALCKKVFYLKKLHLIQVKIDKEVAALLFDALAKHGVEVIATDDIIQSSAYQDYLTAKEAFENIKSPAVVAHSAPTAIRMLNESPKARTSSQPF